MPSATHDVQLAATPQRVFEFVTAVRYFPVWINAVAAVQAISTPDIRAGTTFEIKRTGQRALESWIIAEWDAPRFVRFTEYLADVHLRFEPRPTGDGTLLVARVEWPNRAGLLGYVVPSMSPGAGWSTAIRRALPKLQDMVMLNQDIKLVHGMGDE